ncbi:hypothetical protein PVK06_019420 [Gossypium arboreum]|uniref:Protein phosphatase 1 regulatory subunit 7 n=1 Tax=Gossypium arboreum TaxID=29729 RepID=A0ABR0PJY0_GOSAR|nr:hypothetical protein PVK06_019420 [Gossypium arboreum]
MKSLHYKDCRRPPAQSRNSMSPKMKLLRWRRLTTCMSCKSLNLVMENLQNFTKLQELWLGRNRIKVINLCGLSCIKKISLQSNRLTSMIGLEECNALEEIYLSHNGIAKTEGLSKLVNLRVLDVSSNKLTSVDDIQNLTRLEDLWLNDNRIESLEDIAEGVSGSREKLTTIYLENNPCAQSPNYNATLKQIFPNIQQIDSEGKTGFWK